MKFPSFPLHLSICRKERSGSKAPLQMPKLRSKTAWFGCCERAPKSVGRKFSISHSRSFLFLGTPALIGKLSFEIECGRHRSSWRSLNSFFLLFFYQKVRVISALMSNLEYSGAERYYLNKTHCSHFVCDPSPVWERGDRYRSLNYLSSL